MSATTSEAHARFVNVHHPPVEPADRLSRVGGVNDRHMVLCTPERRTSHVSTDLIDLRELDSSNADVLDAVFSGMSDDSRFLRYLTAMPALPAQARRILTAVDGCNHVAVAAFADGQAIGLARLVGLDDHRAELAVEVVDDWQGHGVGTMLAHWIRDHAADLGYTELVAETSAGNSRAQALTRKLFPGYTARREGTVIVFTLPVGVTRPTAA